MQAEIHAEPSSNVRLDPMPRDPDREEKDERATI